VKARPISEADCTNSLRSSNSATVTTSSALLASGGNYFKELLIDVNLSFIVLPRLLTTVMIASAIPAAISPYSIAVAPLSSETKRLIKTIFCPCI